MSSTTHVQAEIESQPACWRRAAELTPSVATALPGTGEQVAVIGCGTSWFMAQAYAARREYRGLGRTDAFAASEFPVQRRYDRLVAITRSGTTSEVLDVLQELHTHTPTVVITADPSAPVAHATDELVVLDFADEKSVVQTRFATAALALLRTHIGDELDTARAQAEAILATPMDHTLTEYRQYVFLGQGWTVGLAHEAALKMREASLSWAESYPAMDYRHGPISLADPDSMVWFMGGAAPDGLIGEVRATGARAIADELDPMADLIRTQRLAVAAGLARGLDPDRPRNLNRSVVLKADRL
ncbi:sugar isomerase [Actinobacteria bacterium YIM 96077]|uniref:Sugar isomerase n=1 Tax=Phytoactinopolyspora halophila TaxID=1981511 RepID=A0A329QZX3_9ACTN|nr:sugar isomerase [Phytoactinopolyspora halophila]AYY11686.1 sugar isomerase [Actinobacteria bacterium YIM 96077]RAW17881.1 sugar isomerase [Phytoactinopolyspora halophila]